MNKNVVIGILIFVLLIGGTAGYTYYSHKDGINKNATVEDIKFDNDKINVYIFWGSTCSHCEELYEFLYSVEKEEKKYARIYGFEVWENTENGLLMDKFIAANNGKTGERSVPYIVIGDTVLTGFSASDKEKIKTLIKEAYDNKNEFNYHEDLLKNE